ncbi:hypothetical protein J3459_021643 [Metarhizium acridum]|nr:hypothetical protein J3459_021643 [Metarhizium acridum]
MDMGLNVCRSQAASFPAAVEAISHSRILRGDGYSIINLAASSEKPGKKLLMMWQNGLVTRTERLVRMDRIWAVMTILVCIGVMQLRRIHPYHPGRLFPFRSP